MTKTEKELIVEISKAGMEIVDWKHIDGHELPITRKPETDVYEDPIGFNRAFDDLVNIFGEEITTSPLGGSTGATTKINTDKGILILKRGDSDDHYGVRLEKSKNNSIKLQSEEETTSPPDDLLGEIEG